VVWRRTLSPSFAPSLVDQFDRAVATAADETGSRQDLVDVLGRFDPLWDATGRLKPAAVTRYLPRVAAVPPAAVSTWATMSGMDRRRAVFSLAGLESLWTADQFNTLAFAALVAKWRAS